MTDKITKLKVVEIIENFIEGKGNSYDWDDFISIPISDPELEYIRLKCASLPEEFPASSNNEYCGKQGEVVLRDLLHKLKEK